MTVRTFDNRYIISGSSTTRNDSDNSVVSVVLHNTLVGFTGTIDSVNHPQPYTSGGYFNLQKTHSSQGFITGRRNSGSQYIDFINRPVSAPSVYNTLPTVIESRSIEDVLAESNPSKPSVDLPTFFAELRQLPELIWKAGRSIPKGASSANLIYEFGWTPLLSDLRGLLDFQGAVDRRVRHLSNAYRAGGLRFERELGQASMTTSLVSAGTVSPGVTMTHQGMSYVRKWCSVSWVPTEDPRDGIPTPSEVRRRAITAVLGGTVDPATVWNILPWSWLIDWFASTGDYLSAKRNLVGFAPGQCFVMTHSDSRRMHYFKYADPFVGSGKPPIYHRETKNRVLRVPSPLTASLPILTMRQIGILASLAILRS